MKTIMGKSVFGVLLSLCVLFLFPALVLSAPGNYYYEALIDADNNPSTGGSVTVVQGSESPSTIDGIEYRVQAWTISDFGAASLSDGSISAEVAPASPQVVEQDIYKWNGSSFELINQDTNSYDVGMGNGNGGSNAVEFEASRANLGNPAGQMRVVFHASSAGFNDYTNGFLFAANGQIASVPALSWWGLLLLIILLGITAILFQRKRGLQNLLMILLVITTFVTIAWAATITLDGQTGDWTGINPSVTDTFGDSSNGDFNEDILYGYMTSDSSKFYFRIDFAPLD